MGDTRRKRGAVPIKGPWFAMPLDLLRSRAFANLSPHATKLFMDLCSAFGPNSLRNGDITATFSVMKARGWTSKAGLEAAIKELEAAQILITSRQGGRRLCSLYALTPWPLDCDPSKIDIKPGAYTMHDWTQGQGKLQERPSQAQPAAWHQPRKNESAAPATREQRPHTPPPRGHRNEQPCALTPATGAETQVLPISLTPTAGDLSRLAISPPTKHPLTASDESVRRSRAAVRKVSNMRTN
jgi:hypothetical protein